MNDKCQNQEIHDGAIQKINKTSFYCNKCKRKTTTKIHSSVVLTEESAPIIWASECAQCGTPKKIIK